MATAHQIPTLVTDWVTRVIDALGYVGVALLVALENVFPPIPSEVVLPLAGFVAGRGDAWIVGMIGAATAGSVAGAIVLYVVAARLGRERVEALLARHGKWLRLTPHDLERAQSWFDGHSGRAVLICRCVPLMRSLVSIPAGFSRMNLTQFVLFTAVGSAVWNSALICAGYFLGHEWKVAERYMSYLQIAVAAAIAGAAGWFVYKRFAKGNRRPT